MVFEMEKQGKVDLDRVKSPCDVRCLLGWAAVNENMNKLGFDESSVQVSCVPNTRAYNEVYVLDFFGIDSYASYVLFGNRHSGTLTNRYQYLCDLIKEREQALEKPLPDWNKIASVSWESLQLQTLNNLQSWYLAGCPVEAKTNER